MLEIYALRDSENWPPFTFDVVCDILIDRGWPENEVDDMILETQPEDVEGEEE